MSILKWDRRVDHWAERIAEAETPGDQDALAEEIVRVERDAEGHDAKVANMRRENLRLLDRLREWKPPSRPSVLD